MSARRSAQWRARDTDRAEVCARLDAAHTDGQLDDDEHATRIAAATAARTLGDLDALIADLQGSRPRRPIARAGEPLPWRWLFASGTIAAGVAIGAVAGLSVPPGTGSVEYRLTPAGFAQFVDDYRAEFGDTVADEVRASDEHVYVVRQSGPGTTTTYLYDGGFRDFGGSSSRSSSAETFDMSAIDLQRLAGLVAGAPTTARLPEGAVDQIRVDGKEHSVRISVKSSLDQHGHLEVSFDGTVLAVFPYRP